MAQCQFVSRVKPVRTHILNYKIWIKISVQLTSLYDKSMMSRSFNFNLDESVSVLDYILIHSFWYYIGLKVQPALYYSFILLQFLSHHCFFLFFLPFYFSVFFLPLSLFLSLFFITNSIIAHHYSNLFLSFFYLNFYFHLCISSLAL